MSPEIALMVAPDRTYSALAGRASPGGFARALRRPLLVAVVIGTSTALSSTWHLTPALVFSTTLMLSVFVIGQVLIALAVTAGPAAQRIGRARALDLFFASHAAWSLWMLASCWFGGPFRLWLVVAIAPAVVTPRIIAAYFREVLGMNRRSAAVRTVLHQAVTWGLLLIMFGMAVAIWPRILGAFA
jgi:hypothetical protein